NDHRNEEPVDLPAPAVPFGLAVEAQLDLERLAMPLAAIPADTDHAVAVGGDLEALVIALREFVPRRLRLEVRNRPRRPGQQCIDILPLGGREETHLRVAAVAVGPLDTQFSWGAKHVAEGEVVETFLAFLVFE